MNAWAAVAGCIALLSGIASAQDAAPPSFEAVSVKPAAPRLNGAVVTRGGPGTPDPGLLDYRNVNLKYIIQVAYDIEPDQVSGPDWLSTDRFDVQARIAEGASKEQFRAMLQNLLAERFHPTYHRDR